MKNNFSLLILFLLTQAVIAQDTVISKEIISLKYYNENAAMQYLVLENKLKTGQKIDPLRNRTFQLFLDSIATSNNIGSVTTDNDGKAKSFLPPALKEAWEASAQHRFLAVVPGKEDEIAAELEITKAKITIDTISSGEVRTIAVQVSKYENDEWIPAGEVEMKVGIQRLGGILSAGDAETYTTDSSGAVTVELTRDSLPGDQQGNIVLAVKIEDNDQYGNLLVKKAVPWGIAERSGNNFFDQRKLWATNFRTPLWLLFMAYSIVIGVWGTIIYLVLQVFRIKKMGKAAS